MSSSSEVTRSLEYALNRVSAEFREMADDSQEMIDKISLKFEYTCNNPPTRDFEFLLRKPFSDDEVCVALFKPREEQVEYFAALLVAIQSLPESHPTQKLAPLLVSLLFLVHRKDWQFMKTFISGNGLVSLIGLIDSDNLYLRGQVLETILCATDCDIYDWFKPPDSYADKLLHQNMMSFARSNTTMVKLFANRTGSYPGGSFRALQIIAFTLSWIRALYTADQKLQLSASAADSLKLWATKDSASAEHQDQQQQDPEIQLANALLDDFLSVNNMSSSEQPLVSTSTDSVTNNEYVTSAIDVSLLKQTDADAGEIGSSLSGKTGELAFSGGKASYDQQKAPNSTDRNAPGNEELPTLSAVSMKEQGNIEFKAGRYEAAREWYNKALSSIECNSNFTSPSQVTLRVALYSNAATAAWKHAQESLGRLPELELLYHITDQIPLQQHCGLVEIKSFESSLSCCMEDCMSALKLLPYCSKAAYRLAAVHLLKQEPTKALDAVVQCLNALDHRKNAIGVDSVIETEDGSSRADVELLHQMKRKCIAALLLFGKDKSQHTTDMHCMTSKLMAGKTGEVLKNLLVQYQIELDLPASANSSTTSVSLPRGTVTPESDVTSPATKKISSKIKSNLKSASSTNTNKATSISKGGDKYTPATKLIDAKPKKKKATVPDSSAIAKRLQEIDDNMLESLMKRSSIKT